MERSDPGNFHGGRTVGGTAPREWERDRGRWSRAEAESRNGKTVEGRSANGREKRREDTVVGDGADKLLTADQWSVGKGWEDKMGCEKRFTLFGLGKKVRRREK